MGSSDHEFYQLFQAEPRFLQHFVEMNPNLAYTFESVTFKALQRQCDGILRSNDPREATVIFEFQMQKKANIYTRILSEMLMYQHENPDQDVRGVIVFQDPSTDPRNTKWAKVAETCPDLIKVLYLNQIYEDLKQKQPDSPLQAVFAPFVEKDLNLIRQNAIKWLQQLLQLPCDPEQLEKLIDVFMSWLVAAWPDMSKKEFQNMTTLTRDISHTRFYKEVTEEGRQLGRQEGIQKGIKQGLQRGLQQGRIELLREMLAEERISQDYFDDKLQELMHQKPI